VDGGAWRSGGPYGGDVQALALSPDFATDGVALAGGAQIGPSAPDGYGIARTTDRGATWKLLQDAQHRWAVFDLAISPNFSADHTAFAGTDVGLLRSTDRGDTWTWLYNGLPDCTHGSSCAIGRVRLSPAFGADGIALAIPRGGGALYRTGNRGDGWTNVLAGTASAAAFSRNFATNRTVFATLSDAGSGLTQLKRSLDGGLTWMDLMAPPIGQVDDILETVEGGLLLATADGVVRLMPDGAGYVETPASPQVPGPVYRLATAGDNIYAAGFNGLFISLSFGRGWNRMAGTPTTPFQAVAPCPLWGSCHAVMAGTRQGLLGTPDDNWQPWAWLPGPSPVAAQSVSASPAYEADSTLFAGTGFGVFRSTDRGLSWQRVTPADSPGYPYAFPSVQVSPAYATDGTVIATVTDLARPRATLYRSTDRGATWAMLPSVTESGVLALSPAYAADRTLFMASDATLRKSTDGGQTWRSFPMTTPATGFHTLELEASPAYASDRTLFATGYGGTLRSTDGGETWTSVGRYSPAYGLAISPNFAADGTAWHTFRAIESAGDGSPESAVVRTIDRGANWGFATAGLPGVYEPYPFPLAASPRYATDKALYTMLSGQFVAGNSHSLYRAIDGGDWWSDLGPAPGNPDGRDLAVTAFSSGRLTAHAATTDGVWHYEAPCEHRLAAGGFEGGVSALDHFWQRPTTPATAVYSTKYAYGGAQSLSAGIDGTTDVYSYSSANQYFTIPAGASSASLSFWWYPISAEGPLAETSAKRSELALLEQAFAGVVPDEVMAGDRQYVLILNSSGQVLKSLLWTRSNARAWQRATFDLTAYRGLTVRLAFGAYNDGDGNSTALYADEASIVACYPAPPPLPPTPTATATSRPLKATYLPLILRNYLPPPPTPTPTATATPTAPSDILQDRWLRSLVAAPGETGRLWGITNEGYLMRSANRGATWETVVLPADLAGTLANAYVGIDYVNPNTLYLGARDQGLWRSTDGGATWIKRHPLDAGPITVSLDDPATLWAGNWDAIYRPLARSTDGGLTWGTTSQGIATQSSPISPILVDPQAHNVLYSLFMGNRGMGELYRSSDGIWETIPAPINDLPLGWTSPGLMMDGGTRGLYVGSPDGTLSVSFNAFTPVRGEVAWQTVQTFGYQPVPLAVGAGPNGAALYITLRDQSWGPSTRGRVMRSDDGGATWTPITIPPPAGAPATATPTPTATTNCALNPPPTSEPLWVDPVTSPTSLLSQTLQIYLGHGREITVSSEAGVTTVTGTFSSGTPALVPIPLLPNTTHHLSVQGRVEYIAGCYYTLSTGTDRHGAPLTIVQQGPTSSPTPTATQTPTATPTPLQPPITPAACYEGLANGGFEANSSWIIRSNPVLAAYVSTPVHRGARSMRTGIATGATNVASYSPIEQAVTFPAALASAKLSFWRYTVYGDAVVASTANNALDPDTLPRTEAELAAAAPLGADFFYVIGILPDGSIDWLLTESVNAPTWRQSIVDVSRFRGQTIRFQFGTYNNGTGGISRTFVDDAALQICPPAGALVLPAGWVRRVIGRPESRTLYAEAGGLLYRSDDAGSGWRVTGVSHPEHAVLAGNAAVIYAGDGGSCYSGAAPPTWRTTDSGASWQQLPAAKGLKPLAAHPTDSRLYLAGCGGPYLSTNGGDTVTQQTGPVFGVLDTHRVAPAGAAWQDIWVGGVSEGGGGAVLVSRNAGATWTQSTPLGLEMGWYGDLRLDRTLVGWVYAATYYGFFTTQDDGASWLNKSEGLTDAVEPGPAGRSYGLLALAQRPTDPGHRLYLGTVRGLYTRSLAETTWTKIAGQPFDALAVSDLLLLDAAPAGLYVTTPGGVFIHHLSNDPVPPTPTATATPSPTPTPTATATLVAIPTAEPGAWPTPRVLATLNLPPGSQPNGVALDASGDTAYVAFHGVDHSGRFLGVVSTNPLKLNTTVEISAQPAGPNQVAVVPMQGMEPLVAVTARQTDELVLVAPWGIHRRFNVGDMPDGVTAAGRYIYAANFGTDNVSIFDRNTLEEAGMLAVGHEPSLLAADPETGDVYLSLHGANRIARIHDLYIASEHTDIPAPYGLALDPASRRLYVANRGDAHKVTVLDLTTGRLLGAIDVGTEPFVLAVNPNTGHLFVACGGDVRVYRTADWALVATIPVPAGAEEGIAVDTARDRVYVTSRGSDVLTVIQDAAPPLVLFTSDRDGNSEIYSMLPDGREQRRLTTTADSGEGDATGSPDGRWIAYSRVEANGTSHLWLMSRDGHNPRLITPGAGQDSHPTWSTDGTRLAFARYDGGNADIYSLRLADGAVTRLTFGPSAELGPDWSWANGRIALESNQAGANSEIYSMAPDGTDFRRVTINPNGDAQPSWSPEGDHIAFWGSRAEQTLYRMNADGTGLVPLVARTLRPGGPHWGPASAAGWIVFTGYRPTSGYSQIFRMTPNGTELRLLTLNEVNFDAATGWLPGTP
jgi:TolB protein